MFVGIHDTKWPRNLPVVCDVKAGEALGCVLLLLTQLPLTVYSYTTDTGLNSYVRSAEPQCLAEHPETTSSRSAQRCFASLPEHPFSGSGAPRVCKRSARIARSVRRFCSSALLRTQEPRKRQRQQHRRTARVPRLSTHPPVRSRAQ